MQIVDLSVELAHGMVRYPSPYLPSVTLEDAATHEQDARHAQILRCGTHVSTHLDAPYHAIPEGKKIDQLPLGQLCGNALKLRIADGRNAHNPLDTAEFEAFPEKETVEKLILETGWARETWGTGDYFTEGPFLTRAAAEELASWPKLHLIGMDFPNIDSKAETVMGQPNPNHVIILGNDIVLLENLLRLEDCPESFFLSSPPPKLVNGDGCPCRAVAMFPSPFPE